METALTVLGISIAVLLLVRLVWKHDREWYKNHPGVEESFVRFDDEQRPPPQ